MQQLGSCYLAVLAAFQELLPGIVAAAGDPYLIVVAAERCSLTVLAAESFSLTVVAAESCYLAVVAVGRCVVCRETRVLAVDVNISKHSFTLIPVVENQPNYCSNPSSDLCTTMDTHSITDKKSATAVF